MSSRAKPLVSVVMPAYNAERYITEAIDSALEQTYERIEVIVVDDGSTDRTRQIVEGYLGGSEGRVSLLADRGNTGPWKARNEAMAHANGSLICFLDADDIWLPTKVEKQVDLIEARPDVGLAHTLYESFDSDSGDTVSKPGASTPKGDLLVALAVRWDLIGCLTAMFRKEALDPWKSLLNRKSFGYGDDHFLWFLISLYWKVDGVDEVLARYRLHAHNRSFAEGNHFVKRVALLGEFTQEVPEGRERLGKWRRVAIARHYRAAAVHEWSAGTKTLALRYALRGAATDPLDLAYGLLRRAMPGVPARDVPGLTW